MKAYLGRRYRLSASHRLFCESLSEAENQKVYGKCANPHGHGHNYTVEVMVGGEIDEATGMVVRFGGTGWLVEREVLEPFDHQNLNTLESFRGTGADDGESADGDSETAGKGAAAKAHAGGAGGGDVEKFFRVLGRRQREVPAKLARALAESG